MFWYVVISIALVLVFVLFIYLGRHGDRGITGPDDKRNEIPRDRGDFGGFFGG